MDSLERNDTYISNNNYSWSYNIPWAFISIGVTSVLLAIAYFIVSHSV